jgi:DNA adenine methylase
METFQPNNSEQLRPTSRSKKYKETRAQRPASPYRYPGGKTRAIDQIISYIPESVTRLYSAFLGGGSIEIELASRGIEVHGYDLDTELINCWQVLLTQPGRLAECLEKYHPLSKNDFYRLKQNYHRITDPIEKAAAFLAINRCSFNGGIFTSGFSSGKERFTKSVINRVANFKVPNMHVHQADFKDALALHPNDFFYLDPPYVGKEKLYTCSKSGFDHAGLASILTKRDSWLLSYSDCPEVRDLYKEHAIIPLKWAYGMPKNKESNELLIFSQDLNQQKNKKTTAFHDQNKTLKS